MIDVVCLVQDMDKFGLVDIWSGKLGGHGGMRKRVWLAGPRASKP